MSSSFTRVQPLPLVAYTFTDTKLDVEFFTKGTTTPNTLRILRPKILTTLYWIYMTQSKYKLPKLIHDQATKTCNFRVEACNFLNDLVEFLAT